MDSSVSRRMFFKTSSAAAAGVAVAVPATAEAATADAGRTTLPYPRKSVGTASAMKVNEVVSFTYPDSASPCERGGENMVGVWDGARRTALAAVFEHSGVPGARELFKQTEARLDDFGRALLAEHAVGENDGQGCGAERHTENEKSCLVHRSILVRDANTVPRWLLSAAMVKFALTLFISLKIRPPASTSFAEKSEWRRWQMHSRMGHRV